MAYDKIMEEIKIQKYLNPQPIFNDFFEEKLSEKQLRLKKIANTFFGFSMVALTNQSGGSFRYFSILHWCFLFPAAASLS